MAADSKEAHGRAASRLFKEQAIAIGRDQIRQETDAKNLRIGENTARLKELRLAKEADDRASQPEGKKSAPRKRPSSK